jgi:hypothetical protein
MRIHVLNNDLEIPYVLRTYAESRVWLAVQRAADRLSWVGVRFMRPDDEIDGGRVACQLDVWLRGVGLVAVRHVDINPYLALDCAAVRIEQAVIRRLREAGSHPAPARRVTTARRNGATPSAYAVVVLPSDARPRLSLIPWLRTRYGIEQVHTVSLTWPEWDALVAGDIDSRHLKRFKDRLALAQLCRPDTVVVVGGAVPQPSRDEPPQARREVERVVRQILAWGMPLEVIGVWVNEHWGADDCLIESEELPLPARIDGARESESDEEQYAGLTSD